MDNVYLKSSKNTNTTTTRNNPNSTIRVGNNHGNVIFVHDTESETDNDNAAESRLPATETAMQLHDINVSTAVANHPNYEANRITNDAINDVNTQVNDFTIPTSLTLHLHSYSNDLNAYSLQMYQVDISPPPSKLCHSISKFSLGANDTSRGSNSSRINEAEKLGDLFL